MNKSIIRYLLGVVLKIEGGFMLLPCLVALIYREYEGVSFILVAAVAFFVGTMLTLHKPADTQMFLRDGCVTTALSWILLSVVGCLPFVISGEIPSFTDALFETISGFTTTGASILPNVELLSHCALFWRSFTHWLGGMGVLVFLLAVIKMTGGSHMNLMKAESPGPTVGKLVPKVMHSARILYLIYIGLTITMIVLLLAGGMPLFDSICTAVGTAGTGGFGIKADSMASYSAYLQWVVTIFMLLFGVNFNAYYLILLRKWRQAADMEEVKWYFGIVIAAIALIMLTAYDTMISFADNLRNVAFSVASIITTTGFATVDFNGWTQNARIILVILMFIGACAGSTGGGMKVSRIILMAKSFIRELHYYIYPKSVKHVKMDGKDVENDVVRGVHVFVVAFLLVFVLSVFLIGLEGYDLVTSFTSVAATINNIGPGLNLVGPTGNFAFFNPFSKYVLMFDMLAGRLELFPILLLFYPLTWRRVFRGKW